MGLNCCFPFPTVLLAACWFQKCNHHRNQRADTFAKLMLAFLLAAFMPSSWSSFVYCTWITPAITWKIILLTHWTLEKYLNHKFNFVWLFLSDPLAKFSIPAVFLIFASSPLLGHVQLLFFSCHYRMICIGSDLNKQGLLTRTGCPSPF